MNRNNTALEEPLEARGARPTREEPGAREGAPSLSLPQHADDGTSYTNTLVTFTAVPAHASGAAQRASPRSPPDSGAGCVGRLRPGRRRRERRTSRGRAERANTRR